MWKHVWKGVWWKHFYATNACSLSSNPLLFPPPFSHLSPGANICVFVFFFFSVFARCTSSLEKLSVWAIGDIFFFRSPPTTIVFCPNGLFEIRPHLLLCMQGRGKRLALITSRQKTPLTNSKQGARSLLWLTGNTHTHSQKVLFLSGWDEILTLREIIYCCVRSFFVSL